MWQNFLAEDLSWDSEWKEEFGGDNRWKKEIGLGQQMEREIELEPEMEWDAFSESFSADSCRRCQSSQAPCLLRKVTSGHFPTLRHVPTRRGTVRSPMRRFSQQIRCRAVEVLLIQQQHVNMCTQPSQLTSQQHKSTNHRKRFCGVAYLYERRSAHKLRYLFISSKYSG